jgi:hypothetical protein
MRPRTQIPPAVTTALQTLLRPLVLLGWLCIGSPVLLGLDPSLHWELVDENSGGERIKSLRFFVKGNPCDSFILEKSTDLLSFQSDGAYPLESGEITLRRQIRPEARAEYFRIRSLSTSGFVPGQVLLQFDPSLPPEDRALVFDKIGSQSSQTIETPAMSTVGCPSFVCASTSLPVLQALATLRAEPGVLHAEPNWLCSALIAPNDPLFPQEGAWGFRGDEGSPVDEFGSRAAAAWALGDTGSHEVVVGILDSGVDTTHPDLAANIWNHPREIPGNGKDDDGNGKIDDVNGWDFITDTPLGKQSVMDAHGTQIAGVIGAVGNNSLDSAGVNWKVSLLPVRVLRSAKEDVPMDVVIRGLDYLIRLKREEGIRLVAINCSWVVSEPSEFLRRAVVSAAQEGILIIAGAGNNGFNNDCGKAYPANFDTTLQQPGGWAGYDSIISVTSIDRTGRLPANRNYGPASVDLAAPGEGIVTILPEGNTARTAPASGTSMAAAFVTGGVALYASTHPLADAAKLRRSILNSTLRSASLVDKVSTGGRLNLGLIVRNPYNLGYLHVNGTICRQRVPDGTEQRPFCLATDAHDAAKEGQTIILHHAVRLGSKYRFSKSVRFQHVSSP